MATQIAAFDANQELSELLNCARSGETFVTTRHARLFAKLVPIDAAVERGKAEWLNDHPNPLDLPL